MQSQKIDTLTVSDAMIPLAESPVVSEREIVKVAMDRMNNARLGIVCIVDSSNVLLGIMTDGDIRRKLLSSQAPLSSFLVDDALDHAIKKPLTTSASSLLVDAIELMGVRQVWDLPVVDENDVFVGLLHLHPAINAILRELH